MTGLFVTVGKVEKIGNTAVVHIMGPNAEAVFDALMERGWTVAWQEGFVRFGPKGAEVNIPASEVVAQPDAWGVQTEKRFMYSHYGEPLKLYHGMGVLHVPLTTQAGPVAEA